MGKLAKMATCLHQYLFGRCDDEHDVVFRHDQAGRCWLVMVRPAKGDYLRAGRKPPHHLTKSSAVKIGVAQYDFQKLHPDLWLEEHVGEIEK